MLNPSPPPRGDEPMTLEQAREILRREMPPAGLRWYLTAYVHDGNDVNWSGINGDVRVLRPNEFKFFTFRDESQLAPAVAAALKLAREWSK